MKTTNLILMGIILLSLGFQSCEKDLTRINGHGSIVTKELNINDFNRIAIAGISNVHIQYGAVQRVEVRGHSNIIDLIKRRVYNDTWFMELEDGNYGHFQLTYYLTLPDLESIKNSGTGDIYIDDEMTQDELEIQLTGTGSYYGFLMTAEECGVDIVGSGDAEVTALSELDVHIEGTGSVYYKGHPDLQSRVNGTGRIINSN